MQMAKKLLKAAQVVKQTLPKTAGRRPSAPTRTAKISASGQGSGHGWRRTGQRQSLWNTFHPCRTHSSPGNGNRSAHRCARERSRAFAHKNQNVGRPSVCALAAEKPGDPRCRQNREPAPVPSVKKEPTLAMAAGPTSKPAGQTDTAEPTRDPRAGHPRRLTWFGGKRGPDSPGGDVCGEPSGTTVTLCPSIKGWVKQKHSSNSANVHLHL